MVFGNLNDRSASGVGFTRNPATGEKKLYGEFLVKAQGEDVVAGIRTPQPIEKMKKAFASSFKELLKISFVLEKYYRDMQDIEFTVEDGKLWMLQTRTGKRAVQAAVRIAIDQVREGLVSKEEALLRIDPNLIESLFKPRFDPKAKRESLAKGLAASPGAAVGEIAFNPEDAEKMAEEGRKVILVRTETSPEDIHGIAASEGVLTSRGGFTSHAALVTRAMGKPAVVGCEGIEVDYKKGIFRAGKKSFKKGEYISIDGETGEVFAGRIQTLPPKPGKQLDEVLRWADKLRKMEVFANADTPFDARKAREFGAQGIGLCRTEHMFFEESKLDAFQQMILGNSRKDRENALKKILPLQKWDFTEIFKEMEGLPVIIRLLDPPLHEFLPREKKDMTDLSRISKISYQKLKSRVEALKETNPMLGHRGCRLGITYPEIYETQAKAIMEAACSLAKKGKKVLPEIMIPLVLDVREFRILRDMIKDVCEETQKKYGLKLKYKIGTMIELPRAALMAGEIAKEAEFFSFGTNDLTQTTLGISRDDAGRFLPSYISLKILQKDPFLSIDEEGVGKLVLSAKREGRRIRKDLEVGVCGEHGGDPDSIHFFHQAGLNYVSCSPFRVPAARLAAAQAEIKNNEKK
jgi:pyruvate,orthophosphate dikinase